MLTLVLIGACCVFSGLCSKRDPKVSLTRFSDYVCKNRRGSDLLDQFRAPDMTLPRGSLSFNCARLKNFARAANLNRQNSRSSECLFSKGVQERRFMKCTFADRY